MPSTSEVMDKSRKMLEQTSTEGFKPFAGSSFDTPLSSSSLTPQPEIKLEQPKPDTGVAGMLGEIGSNTDAFTQNLADQRKQAEQTMTETKGTYQDFLKSLRGETDLTSEAYAQEGGVDTTQTELNDINQQIRNEQRSLQNKVRAIEEKGGGLQAGAQAEISNIQRESLRTQADLYVIQQGVQGKYDSAKAIADRAVTAYLEKQGLELNALKFGYEENKDLFTRTEQREFDVMFEDRKRALDRQETDMKVISDLSLDALQNGSSPEIASQMRQAKTPQEAMEIGGQYIGLQTRLTQQASRENQKFNRLLDLAKLGQPAALTALGIPTEDGTEPTEDLVAYAAEYAATGKKPSGIPKEIGFGKVADYAKNLPKASGTLVNINTGVRDNSLGTAEQDDLTRLYNIIKMTDDLKEAEKQAWQGLIPGTLGKITGSQAQGTYLKLRKSIVDELARMQTGAALTVDEQAFYEDYLPGRFAEPFGLGQDPDDVIEDFKSIMTKKLNNALSNNQLSIYGYSKVGDYTVGEVIINESGEKAVVNPDGTVTLIN